MPRYIFLDAGPLGLLCKGSSNIKAERCREWSRQVQGMGYDVLVPEIADYEIRREFIRIGNEDWLRQLDALSSVALVPITRAAMVRAAEFWAMLRNNGLGTAPPEALDADAILAAQAVTAARPEDTVIIATTNVGHLERFPGVVAQPWEYIPKE